MSSESHSQDPDVQQLQNAVFGARLGQPQLALGPNTRFTNPDGTTVASNPPVGGIGSVSAQAPFTVLGQAGAAQNYRLAGSTVSGVPTSGTFQANDLVYDQTAKKYLICQGNLYPVTVLADKPVAYWRLNDTGATAIDQVGAFNGTLNGGITTAQTGATTDSDTAMKFNGTTGYVSASGPVFTTLGFSVELWAKIPAYTSQRCLIGCLDATAANTNFQANYSSSTVMRWHVGATERSVTLAAFDDGLYHHWVFVCKANGNLGIYKDGVLVASFSGVGTIQTAGVSLAIGRYGADPIRYFDGTVDEVAIYATELTQTQVTAHYNAGLAAFPYSFVQSPITVTGTTTDISKGGMVHNVLAYGAVADGTILRDVSIAAGTNVLHSPSYTFTAADIGKAIAVNNAGAAVGSAWSSLETTITGISGGDALLGANAVTTVTGPRTVTDASMTLGDCRIGSATAGFGTADSGRTITVSGAGPAGATLTGWLQGMNTTHVITTTEMSTDRPPSTSVTNATLVISGGICGFGTDNRTFIQNALNTAGAAGGGTVLCPLTGTGIYFMSQDPTIQTRTRVQLLLRSNVELVGVPGVVLAGSIGNQANTSTMLYGDPTVTGRWRVRGLIIDQLYEGIEPQASPLWWDGGEDIQVEDNEFRYCSSGVGCGTATVAGGSDMVVSNNFFHLCGGGHLWQPIAASDWLFVNNRSEQATNAGGEMIPTKTCSRYLIANNKLEGGCTFSQNIQGGVGCSDGVIAGNLVKPNAHSAGQAITLSVPCARIVIAGNEFDMTVNSNGGLDNGAIGPGLAAVPSAGTITDIVFVGNLVRHPIPMVASAQGVSWNGSSGGTSAAWLISSNRLVGSGISIGFGTIGVTDFVITDNLVDGTFGDQVATVANLAHSSVIANNKFLDLLGRGHNIGSNDSEYTGNYWSSARDAPVKLQGSTTAGAFRNRIMGGRIHQSAAEGVGATSWIIETTPAGANLYEHIRLTAVSSTVRNVTLVAGGNSVIRNCPGFNPYGPYASTPAFPATGVLAFNTTGMDGVAYVNNGTSAITAISKGALPVPVNLAFVDSATGGTLLHSTTYAYRVAAVMRRGLTVGSFGPLETLASTETSITTGAGADTRTVTVRWLPVPGANYYNVYGRTAAGELFMAKVGGHLNSWVDDGSITPAGALPGSNATARALTGAQIAASTTMPIPLQANEGISFTFAGGAPSWILDLN